MPAKPDFNKPIDNPAVSAELINYLLDIFLMIDTYHSPLVLSVKSKSIFYLLYRL